MTQSASSSLCANVREQASHRLRTPPRELSDVASARKHLVRFAQSLMGLVTVLALEASSISDALAQVVDSTPSAFPPLPAADPCALLTDAEVRKVFPDAKAGERDRSTDEFGIASCVWKHPGGRFALQVQTSEPGTVKNEIEGLAGGATDMGADRNLRYETLSDVGDQAMAVVERADEARGILQDIAVLIAQRGDLQVNLMSSDLASRERAEALQTLAKLGRAAVQRL